MYKQIKEGRFGGRYSSIDLRNKVVKVEPLQNKLIPDYIEKIGLKYIKEIELPPITWKPLVVLYFDKKEMKIMLLWAEG